MNGAQKLKSRPTLVSLTKNPLMPATVGVVRDCQPFRDARFSSREVMRFFGIKLDWPPAAQIACMAAHLMNVF
jgi:hypothetical protein